MTKCFRMVIVALGVLGSLAAAPSATAMDRYVFKPLPHLGFGGEALGITGNYDAGTGILSIVGRVETSTNDYASVWRADGAGGFTLTVLPGIGGTDGEANSIVFDDGTGPHHRVIAGAAQSSAGVWKPVLWTEDTDGAFTPHVLPTAGGVGGSAASIRRCVFPLCGGVWIAGRTDRADGSRRATAWHRNALGEVDTHNLGTLGGTNSDAISIEFTGAGIVVVGTADTASGDGHAALWRSTDGGSTWQITDRHPGGVSSSFTGSSYLDTCLFAAGTALTANGRSIAGFQDTCIAEWDALTAPGFRNSSAAAILATRYGNLTIGRVWDDTDLTWPIAWNTIDALGTRVYPISAFTLTGGTGDADLDVLAVGPGIMAGHYGDGKLAGVVAPMVLVADGARLPDLVDVTVGMAHEYGHVLMLWSSGDGSTLRIRTRNNDGDAASFDARFYSATLEFDTELLSLNLRSRAVGGDSATGQLEVQLFNFETNSFDTVGTAFANTTFDDAAITAPAAGHVHPVTGEVRARVNFMGLSGGVRGVEIDSLIVTPAS